jgi:glycosyltransferase involved in cell wall biosynthesis
VKGVDLLVRVLTDLPVSLRKETVLLLMGGGSEALPRDFDMTVMSLGFLESDRLKAMAYSAADVFVSPARAETFGLVLIESIACGTPVVSFRVGGVPDIVRPGLTGFLADPEDAKQLSSGIVQLLEDGPLRTRMSAHCREIAVKEYNLGDFLKRTSLMAIASPQRGEVDAGKHRVGTRGEPFPEITLVSVVPPARR